jgi:hypothetical protein
MTTTEYPQSSTPSSTPPPSNAGDAAQSVAHHAADEGRAVVDTAKSESARLVSTARDELRKQGDQQTRRIAENVRGVGSQLDAMARGEAPPEGVVADVVRGTANRANQFASRLDEGGLDAVTSDVKQFARQRPVVFLAGAFGLGVLAGRVLRNADTQSLAQAAKPSSGGTDSPSSLGSESPSSWGTDSTQKTEYTP